MYASPGVTVNGSQQFAHEVLPGDVIEISPNGTATFLPSGDEVHVEPRSSAVYTNQRQIELRNGTSTITTKTGVAVHVHHYMVTPTTASSRYQVSWAPEGGRVWVYEGEVRIDGCQKKLTVPKDKIAELGRDCKLGAYLRPPGGGSVAAVGLVVPAVPLLCYYECREDESSDGKNDKLKAGSRHP
jgi:hypothetical protein